MNRSSPPTRRAVRLALSALLAICALGTAERGRTEPSTEPSLQLSDDARVTRLNEEGNRLHSEGAYRKALESFIQAYAIDNDPNLLFNIGHCYEQMGDDEAAAEKYRAFLAGRHTDPKGRQRAQTLLQALEKKRTLPLLALAPEDHPAPSSSLVPLLVLSTGGVLAATGAVFYGLGIRDHNQVIGARTSGAPDEVSPLTRSEAVELTRGGTRRKAIGGAAIALGISTLAAYVGLYAFESLDSDAPVVSVVNANGGAHVRLEGEF